MLDPVDRQLAPIELDDPYGGLPDLRYAPRHRTIEPDVVARVDPSWVNQQWLLTVRRIVRIGPPARRVCEGKEVLLPRAVADQA